MRLRHAHSLHLHNLKLRREHRRVQRVRRRFIYALLGVAIYLLAISPTVFVKLDNPRRIAQGMPELDWSEGLYWSVITLTTVGYGDIVPQTPYARMFALFNAILGVTTMGTIAGLVVSAMTPRRVV
jgi:voltage-gated potassium channel